jgi:hypothetical protein
MRGPPSHSVDSTIDSVLSKFAVDRVAAEVCTPRPWDRRSEDDVLLLIISQRDELKLLAKIGSVAASNTHRAMPSPIARMLLARRLRWTDSAWNGRLRARLPASSIPSDRVIERHRRDAQPCTERPADVEPDPVCVSDRSQGPEIVARATVDCPSGPDNRYGRPTVASIGFDHAAVRVRINPPCVAG